MKILVLNASATGVTNDLFARAKVDYEKQYGPADFTEIKMSQFNESLTSENMGTTFYAEGTKYIDLMQQFDEVILIAGMENYAMPAVVKNFLDKITLAKVTFAYNAQGVYSPMQGKWRPNFFLFVSSGTDKAYFKHETPKRFVESVTDVLEFNGFEKSQLMYVWADGTNMPNVVSMTPEQRYEHFKNKLLNPIVLK